MIAGKTRGSSRRASSSWRRRWSSWPSTARRPSPSSASPSAAASPAARSTGAGPTCPRLYFEAFRQLRGRDAHPPTGELAVDLANYIRDTAAHLNDPTYFSIVVFLLANAAVSEYYATLYRELFNVGSSRGAEVFSGRHRAWARSGQASTSGRRRTRCGRLSSTPASAKQEPIDVDVALLAVPIVIRTYGTADSSLALLDRAACAPGRGGTLDGQAFDPRQASEPPSMR